MRDLFTQVLNKIKDGMSITFTTKNIAYGDDFLILYPDRPCKVTFKNFGLWYVLFDGDEPMLLEDCPESFYESILKNIK
jgi:hypothetical protein